MSRLPRWVTRPRPRRFTDLARRAARRVRGHVGPSAQPPLTARQKGDSPRCPATRNRQPPLRKVRSVFAFVHGVMAALALIVVATNVAWHAFDGPLDHGAAQSLIEAVGLLAAAVVALQIAQTIAEEEIVRAVHISAPTRVRRFLSRFLVVVVVALAIEGLVATFGALHSDPSQLGHAASILFGVAAILAGWGIFVRLNRYAEELEPEAMAEAVNEDRKLD